MASLLRIALVFSHSLAYCRGVLRGIKQYAEATPQWVFMPVAPEANIVSTLRPLKPAGVIAHVFSPELARALPRLSVPIVNVCGVLPDLALPRVGVDDHLCGSLAADHLLERGIRHFAFVGHKNHAYSVRREEGFRQVLSQKGFPLDVYYERRQRPFDPMGRLWSLDESIHRWVCSLPKPVGIFAPNDIWGVQLTEICRQTNLNVPEEVAIVGVDDDDLLCGLALPRLSSVALPTERIGFKAAAMLNQMLKGKRKTLLPLLFPPRGVIARRSTEVLAIADAEVVSALRFIRESAHRSIRVSDILRTVPVSRRSLERRFRKALGRSLLQEIRRVHVERANELLAQTDLPMGAVAEGSGFGDAKRLSTVLKQATGRTPTGYRQQFRCGVSPSS